MNSWIDIVLKSIPVAMGTDVAVLSLLGELDVTSGFTLLGIGLACTGIFLLKHQS